MIVFNKLFIQSYYCRSNFTNSSNKSKSLSRYNHVVLINKTLQNPSSKALVYKNLRLESKSNRRSLQVKDVRNLKFIPIETLFENNVDRAYIDKSLHFRIGKERMY